ncbi:MAG: flagellar hook-associated protein FlgL [Phycisphaerae bacterium]|nr:flagellar hook-associated protein FlgL [Phycisphaerae bacterium]
MAYSLEAIYNSVSWAISSHTRKLSSLQEQASSGQEINRPSDNPYDANRILSLRTESRSMERYVNAVTEVINVLDFSSSVVQQMTGERGLGGARASLTSALTPIYSDPAVRTQKAAEINEILEEMVSLANKQRMGQRLFGGAQSDSDPYLVERGGDGQIQRVIYQGSQEERNINVAPGVETSAVLVGDQLFRADDAEIPVFYGSTGTAAGTGTSSVRGDFVLSVSGSAGAWVLSIDGGTTTVTATGTETNLAVVNGATGEVLYVDATGITQTGNDYVRVPGTYDVFNVLIHCRDLLTNTENLSQEQWDSVMRATVDELALVEQKLVRAYPLIGGRLETLTNLKSSLEDIKMNADEEISARQDADITQVAVDLARYEVLYEMSLQVAAKMFSMSLMDFIG